MIANWLNQKAKSWSRKQLRTGLGLFCLLFLLLLSLEIYRAFSAQPLKVDTQSNLHPHIGQPFIRPQDTLNTLKKSNHGK